MNIWLEYFKYNNKSNNYHAQMKENVKWSAPDKKDIQRRPCIDREQALKIAKSLQDQGYHVSIKTDGPI
jgi:hypothetical protein